MTKIKSGSKIKNVTDLTIGSVTDQISDRSITMTSISPMYWKMAPSISNTNDAQIQMSQDIYIKMYSPDNGGITQFRLPSSTFNLSQNNSAVVIRVNRAATGTVNLSGGSVPLLANRYTVISDINDMTSLGPSILDNKDYIVLFVRKDSGSENAPILEIPLLGKNLSPGQFIFPDTEIPTIYNVDVHDPINTTLPTTTTSLDGVNVVDGMTVLFSNLSTAGTKDKVYAAYFDGPNLLWKAVPMFTNSVFQSLTSNPSDQVLVKIQKGIAYNGQIAKYELPRVISAIRTSNISTFTLSRNHSLSVSDSVSIADMSDSSFNGSFTVVSTPSANTFTVANAGTDTSLIPSYGGIFPSTAGTINGFWNFGDIKRQFNSGGKYHEISAPRDLSLNASTTDNVLSIPFINNDNLILNYSLKRGTNKQTGQLLVTSNGITAAVSDVSAQVGACGISFTADIVGLNLRVRYTSDGSGGSTSMTYSVMSWSDSIGGVAGLPAYDPISTVIAGNIQTAFAMSDGSGIEVNCSAPTVVSAKTRLTLNFTYNMNVNPGTTGGHLEVIVDGAVLPRYLAGVTLDAYYKEIDNQTIEFATDYTSLPISLEVRIRQGVIDVSPQNSARLGALYDAIVGSAGDIASGKATHTTLSAALAAINDGDTILMLRGTHTHTSATLNLTKSAVIYGQGRNTILDFNLNITSDYNLVKFLKFNKNVTINAGSDKSIYHDFWISASGSIVDSGLDNIVIGIQE